MIVIGIDPHMKSHTAVAVDAASGRTLAEKTVSSDAMRAMRTSIPACAAAAAMPFSSAAALSSICA